MKLLLALALIISVPVFASHEDKDDLAVTYIKNALFRKRKSMFTNAKYLIAPSEKKLKKSQSFYHWGKLSNMTPSKAPLAIHGEEVWNYGTALAESHWGHVRSSNKEGDGWYFAYDPLASMDYGTHTEKKGSFDYRDNNWMMVEVNLPAGTPYIDFIDRQGKYESDGKYERDFVGDESSDLVFTPREYLFFFKRYCNSISKLEIKRVYSGTGVDSVLQNLEQFCSYSIPTANKVVHQVSFRNIPQAARDWDRTFKGNYSFLRSEWNGQPMIILGALPVGARLSVVTGFGPKDGIDPDGLYCRLQNWIRIMNGEPEKLYVTEVYTGLYLKLPSHLYFDTIHWPACHFPVSQDDWVRKEILEYQDDYMMPRYLRKD